MPPPHSAPEVARGRALPVAPGDVRRRPVEEERLARQPGDHHVGGELRLREGVGLRSGDAREHARGDPEELGVPVEPADDDRPVAWDAIAPDVWQGHGGDAGRREAEGPSGRRRREGVACADQAWFPGQRVLGERRVHRSRAGADDRREHVGARHRSQPARGFERPLEYDLPALVGASDATERDARRDAGSGVERHAPEAGFARARSERTVRSREQRIRLVLDAPSRDVVVDHPVDHAVGPAVDVQHGGAAAGRGRRRRRRLGRAPVVGRGPSTGLHVGPPRDRRLRPGVSRSGFDGDLRTGVDLGRGNRPTAADREKQHPARPHARRIAGRLGDARDERVAERERQVHEQWRQSMGDGAPRLVGLPCLLPFGEASTRALAQWPPARLCRTTSP